LILLSDSQAVEVKLPCCWRIYFRKGHEYSAVNDSVNEGGEDEKEERGKVIMTRVDVLTPRATKHPESDPGAAREREERERERENRRERKRKRETQRETGRER